MYAIEEIVNFLKLQLISIALVPSSFKIKEKNSTLRPLLINNSNQCSLIDES